jgi:hypothetical protein
MQRIMPMYYRTLMADHKQSNLLFINNSPNKSNGKLKRIGREGGGEVVLNVITFNEGKKTVFLVSQIAHGQILYPSKLMHYSKYRDE